MMFKAMKTLTSCQSQRYIGDEKENEGDGDGDGDTRQLPV